MSDQPWLGDACSLVDAFRAGDLSPLESLDASLGAIERSQLNAFCHVDPERSRAWAQAADVSLPFGGVAIGVKEIEETIATMARIPPKTVSKDDATVLKHLDQTLDEATHRLQGNYAADVKDYDAIEQHAIVMADALSGGIIAQFPEKFRGAKSKMASR